MEEAIKKLEGMWFFKTASYGDTAPYEISYSEISAELEYLTSYWGLDIFEDPPMEALVRVLAKKTFLPFEGEIAVSGFIAHDTDRASSPWAIYRWVEEHGEPKLIEEPAFCCRFSGAI